MTLADTKELVRFLNKESSLPIVCHNMSFDRDDVLRPVFKKLNNPKGLPTKDRWVCTYELAKQRRDIIPFKVKKSLDSLLAFFGLEGRGPG